ncbi:hypothetical protein [Actinomadura rubrisoli]|uniref:Uncharacterized protein n=1 Tax=Actinomadura rubrisoli TaxID=2530368 RepID=A0A4V2YU70_9ACTN|nr:hypothetical protein [Actinomadura rubrisoli]TDD76577.1 hypothetical protein E1298_30585 [Actinomadura rubrisoli]
MAPVAALVAYAVYRDSYWLAAFGIPIAISALRTQHPYPIAAEVLAAEIRAHLRSGRVLLITVAQHGTLRIFRAQRGPRMSTKGYRLLDQCPHCFVEGRVAEMFNDTVAGGVIEHYRAKLAANRPVELQLTRSMAPPAGALVVDAPGEPWVLNYFYPSNRTWRVAFPVACDAHNPAAPFDPE